MTNATAAVVVQFRGLSYTVPFDQGSATCSVFIQALQQAVPGLAAETLKVLVSKPKARNLQLAQHPELRLVDAGISPGMKLMLLGSFTSELQALHANKQAEVSLRLPDFDHEAQRVAQRRSVRGSSTADGPIGRHCFGWFDVLPRPPGAPPQAPPPSAALGLLHRIATDPAIVHVMTTYGWEVGLLSEMAPEGKVGVSAMCVLGYNVNKGQEISLRLRTDDYGGFRKYLRIRETLVHELAHMVYAEHDNDFKALNSHLLKEVAAHEAAATGGRTLAGAGVFEDDWLGHQQQEPATVRGRTVGGGAMIAAAASSSAREAAAAAALTRWQQQQAQQQLMPAQQQGSSDAVAANVAGSDVVTAGSGPIPAELLDQVMVDADNASTATAAAGTADVTADVSALPEAAAAGISQVDDGSLTEDAATAAAEAAMRRLGSLEHPQDGQCPKGLPASQPQQQNLLQSGTPAAGVLTRAQQHVQQAETDCSGDQQLEQGHQQQTSADISPHHIDIERQVQQYKSQGPCAEPVAVEQEGLPVMEAGAEGSGRADHGGGISSAAAAGDAQDVLSATDDVVVAQKLQRARLLLQQLQQQAHSSQEPLGALQGVLSSIAQHPQNQQYRRLRCGNATFRRKLGQYSAAVQLLLLAGFVEQQVQWREGGTLEPVLVYVRNDPGLLWLVLSVVKEFYQQ